MCYSESNGVLECKGVSMSASGLAPVNISLITSQVNPITIFYHTGTKFYRLLNKESFYTSGKVLFFLYFSFTGKRFGLTVEGFFCGQYSHVFIVFVARGQG